MALPQPGGLLPGGFFLLTLCTALLATASGQHVKCEDATGDIYNYHFETLQKDRNVSLSEYRGKVVLIMNTATYWGYTKQYLDMNAPVRDLSPNFDIVAFPSNQFGLQEPGNGLEILNGIRYARPGNNFIPEFTMATKGDVNGLNEQPLFTYLKSACGPTTKRMGDRMRMYWDPIMVGDITWNFEKFLVDASGKVRYRFHPSTQISEAVRFARELIAEKKQAPTSGQERTSGVMTDVRRKLQSMLDEY